MIMYKYETTDLNSLRAIISRAGIGEASLSISPYLLTPSFVLGSSFYFLLEKMQCTLLSKKVPDRYRIFLTPEDISWIFLCT